MPHCTAVLAPGGCWYKVAAARAAPAVCHLQAPPRTAAAWAPAAGAAHQPASPATPPSRAPRTQVSFFDFLLYLTTFLVVIFAGIYWGMLAGGERGRGLGGGGGT